ncbi:MAG: M20/M25/M40 family metallo-hydrolase [Aggregatilineales bacterium]
MTATHEYAHDHHAQFKQDFIDLIRIKSISTDPAFADNVTDAANWLVTKMQAAGMEAETIRMEAGRHPLVLGTWMGAGDDAPTVLIYCHYDVQPAVVEDGWDTDPFTPTEIDGKLFARGASDSKIHVISWLSAATSLLATDACPVNIKLLFEGEEESGGETISAFIKAHPERVAADVVIISDGSIISPQQPSLVYGLRGIVTMELHITGPHRDLHSGHYGGSVHNPIQALSEILAQLHDETGKVTVPGFYDNVLPLDDEEREILRAVLPYVEPEWDEVANAPAHWGEPDYTLHERTGARPTLEINGIAGGYYGAGFKTVLPSRAMAKISCRLVANQDPDRILELVKNHIAALTPESVTSELLLHEMGAPAIVLDRNSSAIQSAASAYSQSYGVSPIFARAGGSIPITYAFANITDNVAIMGFTYKGGGAHGPNENVILDMFSKGIDTAIYMLQEVGQ